MSTKLTPLEIAEFYVGSEERETPTSHPTIRMNAEDYATIVEEVRLCVKLREAAMNVRRRSYLDDDVLNRHSCTTTSCEALRELFALTEPTP